MITVKFQHSSIQKSIQKILFIYFLFWQTVLFGQNNKCSLIYSSNQLDYTGTNNIELIKFTQDCFRKLSLIPPTNLLILELRNEGNCYAGTYMNRPFLAFDVEWLNNIRTTSDWSSIFIIGHEIGHLIEQHSLRLPNKLNELEADTWGAMLVSRFNYPHTTFNNDFPKIILETRESYTHPSGVQRLAHINTVLANANKTILSLFGPITFQIDRWNSDLQSQFHQLRTDLSTLEHAGTKANLIRVIESLNYSERHLENSQDLILNIIEYGIVLNQISAEEAYKFISSQNNLKHDLNNSIKLHRIFSHSANFNYFTKLVDIDLLREQISQINVEKISNHLNTAVLKLCVTLKIHENQHPKLINLHDIDTMLNAIQNSNCEKTIDYYDALLIYNNFIGDYNKAEIYASNSLKLWNAEFNIRNSYENQDLWSRENLCLSLYNLGLVQFRQKNYIDALQKFNEAKILSNRTFVLNDIYYMTARTYFHLSDHKNALEYIYKVTINEDPFELMIRAQILLANNLDNEAKYFLRRSCELYNSWSCAKLKQLL